MYGVPTDQSHKYSTTRSTYKSTPTHSFISSVAVAACDRAELQHVVFHLSKAQHSSRRKKSTVDLFSLYYYPSIFLPLRRSFLSRRLFLDIFPVLYLHICLTCSPSRGCMKNFQDFVYSDDPAVASFDNDERLDVNKCSHQQNDHG